MVLSRLKEHRRRRALTQMELAKLSDVGRATIAALETGRRTRVHAATREKLAKALKVRPHELNGGNRDHGEHREAEAQDQDRALARAAAGARAG
jgi:transcriptional regulator with XRE-family HTH domain